MKGFSRRHFSTRDARSNEDRTSRGERIVCNMWAFTRCNSLQDINRSFLNCLNGPVTSSVESSRTLDRMLEMSGLSEQGELLKKQGKGKKMV